MSEILKPGTIIRVLNGPAIGCVFATNQLAKVTGFDGDHDFPLYYITFLPPVKKQRRKKGQFSIVKPWIDEGIVEVLL